MANPTQQPVTTCPHCDKAIPVSNIVLHFIHCSRKLERCKDCGKMVPKMLAEEHYIDAHAPQVVCPICLEMVEREMFAHHRDETCPQRIDSCEYCGALLFAACLFQHQERCGRWKERCYRCGKNIRRRELDAHWTRCLGSSDGSSSDTSSSQERQDARNKQPPDDSSPNRLLLAVAIAGVSVLLNVLGTFILLQVKK